MNKYAVVIIFSAITMLVQAGEKTNQILNQFKVRIDQEMQDSDKKTAHCFAMLIKKIEKLPVMNKTDDTWDADAYHMLDTKDQEDMQKLLIELAKKVCSNEEWCAFVEDETKALNEFENEHSDVKWHTAAILFSNPELTSKFMSARDEVEKQALESLRKNY